MLDHLWQSLLFFALVCAMAWLTRGNGARLRLWLWRLAAIKWLLPFSLLVALGTWLGFPIRYAGDPPPARLVTLVESAAPWLRASEWFDSSAARTALVAALLLAAAAAARWTLWRIHREARATADEDARLAISPDDREPSIGFLRAAAITACALLVISAPLLAGAIRGGVHDHEVLLANTRSLSEGRVTVRPARPGLGSRYFVHVDAGGVTIRNVTIRELTALAYGVNRFFVRGDHFRTDQAEDWLVDTRQDVRIDARVIEPEDFDTFAMQPAITRELARNFGLEIYVNNECQKPCGKWGDRVLVEVSPGRFALVDAQQVAGEAREEPEP